MAGDLVTRPALVRALAVNAATRPLNLAVPGGVGAAAVLLHTSWLVLVAILVYLGMAVSTFFDGDEAERVGQATYARARPAAHAALDIATLAEPIARKLVRARHEEARIRAAVERGPLPRYDILDEVTRLMTGLEKLARRAQQIHLYLAEQDQLEIADRLHRLRSGAETDPAIAQANQEAAAALADQLAVVRHLERQLARFDAQMENAVASLAAIHGQMVRMDASEEAAAQRDVAADVRRLRREVNATADAMRETYDDLSDEDQP